MSQCKQPRSESRFHLIFMKKSCKTNVVAQESQVNEFLHGEKQCYFII